MAKYVIDFHAPTGETMARQALQIDIPNRQEANKLAIVIAKLFYSALVHDTEESRVELWGAMGNDTDEALDNIRPWHDDWAMCGASLRFINKGADDLTVFSMNPLLVRYLTGREPVLNNAAKSAELAASIIRKTI